jgi:CheY-specific phosphatase CheX
MKEGLEQFKKIFEDVYTWDAVEVLSLENESLGIKQPCIKFHGVKCIVGLESDISIGNMIFLVPKNGIQSVIEGLTKFLKDNKEEKKECK